MLRSKVIRLAYTHPELRPHLLPLLGAKLSAGGSRPFRDVDPADYVALQISAAYMTPGGDERWFNSLMRLSPKALDNPSQWTDDSLSKFMAKAEKAKGKPFFLIRVYGQTPDGKLVTLIDWSPSLGFSTSRETARLVQNQTNAARQETADRRNFDKLLFAALKRSHKQVDRASAGGFVLEGLHLVTYTPSSGDKDQRFFWNLKLNGRDFDSGFTTATTAREAIPEILTGVKAALKRKPKPKPEPKYEAEKEPWSVVQTEMDSSYASEVELFDSKSTAIAYAKDLGGVYVVRGTQMWNEPLGQVEEHNRNAWYAQY